MVAQAKFSSGEREAARMAGEVLGELRAAHLIIRHALNLMTDGQKTQWAGMNAAAMVDGEGITRANERARAISRCEQWISILERRAERVEAAESAGELARVHAEAYPAGQAFIERRPAGFAVLCNDGGAAGRPTLYGIFESEDEARALLRTL